MSTPFRFVIVGSGGISKAYIQAIGNLDGIELAGLVSRSGQRPEGLPESVPVFPALGQVTAGFDAVVIATPNGLHHQGAAEAAALGKHVLVEKVLDVSIENMDRMVAASNSAGVTLAVTYQRRMSPDNQALKKLLDNGTLGQPYAAVMDVKYYRDQSYYDSGAYRGGWAIDGGGPFIQQAAHNADLLCWFFGMPEKVASMCDRFAHDIEVDDHGVALLRYPDGLIVTFTASTICKPGYPTRFELVTGKGSVIMENDQIVNWAIDGVDNPAAERFEVHDGSTSATVGDTAGHEAILRDFADAVREGRPPAIPAESGRLATELVLLIYGNNLLRA